MFRWIPVAALFATVSLVFARAQDESHMSMHMVSQAEDTRQLLDFPPHLRQHMMSNMRDHLEALSEIFGALSTGDGGKAVRIAEARLGLGSPDAAVCNPNHRENTTAMAAMMAEYMPDDMRERGFAMHEAASEFARETAKAQLSNDLKPAFAALSQVIEKCAACHSAYRLN